MRVLTVTLAGSLFDSFVLFFQSQPESIVQYIQKQTSDSFRDDFDLGFFFFEVFVTWIV